MERGIVYAVDDNQYNLDLIEAILTGKNFKVKTFLSGHDFINHIKEDPDADIILLDVMMPGYTGFQVIEDLKKIDFLKDIPVIFVTALSDMDNLSKAFSLGAVDYVTKPIKSKELIARVNTHIKLRRSMIKIEKLNEEIMEDLENAKKIQISMLPKKFPNYQKLRFAGKYIPWIKVGGDFYDVFCTREKELFFYIADVAGHGVAAAMLTIVVKESIREIITDLKIEKKEITPSMLMHYLNKRITNEFEQYLTMAIFKVSANRENEIIYSIAGHHAFPILYKNRGKSVIILEEKSFPIGWIDEVNYKDKKIEVEKGDKLFLYTDGIIEAESPEGEQYSIERFVEFVKSNANMELNEFIAKVEKEIIDFSNNNFSDDFTILGVEFCL